MFKLLVVSTALAITDVASGKQFTATKPGIRGELKKQWDRSLASEGFDTMIESTSSRWEFNVIFTIGETIDGYTPPGILDGMGAYELDENTVRALVNHELLNFDGYAYTLNPGTSDSFTLTGSRVSYFDIDKETRTVTATGLAYNKLFNADGSLITSAAELSPQGLSGLSRFCSGRLVFPNLYGRDRGIVDLIYFAPEEDGGRFNPVGGNIWALDVVNEEMHRVAAFGRGAWENITPVDTKSKRYVAFMLADDTSPTDFDDDGNVDPVPMYLYIGTKIAGGNFLERNGLTNGSLYVWKSNTGETRPSQFRGAGNSLEGKWIQIDSAPKPEMASVDGSSGYDTFGYPVQGTLVLQANALGAFGFSRPEDLHENPRDGTQVVSVSTGVDTYDVLESGDGADTFGTIYIFNNHIPESMDDDLRCDLRILYDGNTDLERTLRSPDNIDWSRNRQVCVTEDRAERQSLTGEPLFGEDAANTNEAGVLCIDTRKEFGEEKFISRLGNIDRDVVLDASIDDPRDAIDQDAGDAGAWESSGILDVSDLFGLRAGRLYLVNVQAHGIDDQDDFSNTTRITDDDLKEGGQLIFMTRV